MTVDSLNGSQPCPPSTGALESARASADAPGAHTGRWAVRGGTVWVNTFLVRERDRRRQRELVRVLAVVLCLGGGLLAYTWIHLEALRTGYAIDSLEKRLAELSQKERRLRLEAAYLAGPSQIEQRATRELGMQPPALEQVVFWEEIP